VDRTHAVVAFRSERYLAARGWTLPPVWDPIAGDYATRDGWIRLHTNYAYHRAAALRVLGASESRDDVARAVRAWDGEHLEAAVVGAGGCAARSRTAAEWASHPQGIAVARSPLFERSLHPCPSPPIGPGTGAPLEGVRVLDLTRVMAGPVCTRVLAAYGADVLRVDPPGFLEVPALLPEMTAGKRRAFVDLRTPEGRQVLERLIEGAHVMVHGYRNGALEGAGLGAARRRQINPALVDVSVDAYGFSGPWADRRGFDSLVQMSTGIAERGRDAPFPLPAQALDHAAGYLMAAAACHGLARAVVDKTASTARVSLARVAHLLVELGETSDLAAPDLADDEVERCCEIAETAFGPVRRVRCPGRIEGVDARWTIPAGPLGTDAPVWS
jgi:hypothetical protein